MLQAKDCTCIIVLSFTFPKKDTPAPRSTLHIQAGVTVVYSEDADFFCEKKKKRHAGN